MEFEKILQDNWGYTSFRPLQREIIESVCSGRDTVAILPTGGGKSITFQVPALALDGLTIVVSPLVALMTDQVENLRRRGIRATVLHAGLRRDEILHQLEQAEFGAYRLLYVSPERLTSPLFIKRLTFLNVKLIAVDEAHCVSEWGYDFRPTYLRIPELRSFFPEATMLALTASSTPDVTADIIDKLQMRQPAMFRASVARDNLIYVVRETRDRDVELMHILRSVPGTAIVYTRSRANAEEVATMLAGNDFSASYYHAGLEAEERTRRQQRWMTGETRILCSTNAFGMGIDKPDVRLVVHYDIPDALEAYYQEAGRAGRDGHTAYAVALSTPTTPDMVLRRHQRAFPPKEFIADVYQSLANQYEVGVGSGEGATFAFHFEEFCHRWHYNYGAAQAALKVLEWSNLITVTEAMDDASKLKIIMSPSEIFEWRMKNPADDRILETVMRLYTGIFTDPQHISETYIARACHITDTTKIYNYLINLRRQGIVHYVPFKRTPLIIYNTARVDPDELFIPRSAYENRIERMFQRLQAIHQYITTTDCRTTTLAHYFGENDAFPCGICDNCRAKQHSH